MAGSNQQLQTTDCSDAALNMGGYISITPMIADLTSYEVLEALQVGE